jgi:Flp pilus assembly protein TadD
MKLRNAYGFLFALFLSATGTARAGPAGEIVSLAGRGEYRAVSARDWAPARVRQGLEGGSFVRTVSIDAKMGVLLADRTQFTLQGVATAQVKDPGDSSAGKSIVDMVKGTGRFQSKTPTRGFAVGMPSGLAAIRGTEWVIDVDDERSVVTVVDGEVLVSNELGQVSVLPDEQAILEKGKAPTKRRIQNARERVQWVSAFTVETARYPELKSLPASAEGEALRAIAKAVDAGDLASARTLAMVHVAKPGLSLATGHFLAADIALWFGAAAEAQALLADAGKRFPAEKRTDAYVAWAALFADRFDAAREAAARALARSPDTLESQLAAGEVARLDGDYAGARAAFREATRIAPQDWRGWHGLARVEGERGNVEIARGAFGKALALEKRAVVLGERGALEAGAGEMQAAARTLDAAIALQADDYTTWAGKGYERLRAGDPDGAIDALVRATMLEPRYARAHIHLAVAYWQKGLREQAFASLRRASEADPRDPLPYQYAAMMRGDLLQPGLAVEQAAAALERLPYAKSLDAISGSTRGLANLGAVYAQFGLESWALRNAQESYDPFWAGSHFFLADRYASRYARNSELFQGFLTDPMAIGGSNTFQTLVTRGGAYGLLGFRGARDSATSLTEPIVTVNGLTGDGMVAGFAEAAELRTWKKDDSAEERATSTTFGLGLRPRHDVGVFVYGNRLLPDSRAGEDDPAANYAIIAGSARRIDGGFSWCPSADSLLWVKGGNGSEDSVLRDNLVTSIPPGSAASYARGSEFTVQPRRGDAQARWLSRLAGGHEVSLGAEAARWNAVEYLERDASFHESGEPGLTESVRQDIRDESRVVALAGRMRLQAVTLEAQVDWTDYEKVNDILVRRDYAGQVVALEDDHARDGANGRAGVEWRPVAGLTARAAWQRWLRPAAIGSLGATATAGIAVDDRFVLPGGKLERTRAQLEWEAAKGLLLAAYADRQEIDNLYSELAGTLNNRPDSSNLERLRNRSFNNLASLNELEGYPALSRGELREAGASVNFIPSRHLSLYAEGVYSDSENTLASPGALFAYLPKKRAALGATLFTDRRILVGARAIYRGERFRDEANSPALRLPAEWVGTVQAYWETADKRWSVELLVTNIASKSADETWGFAVNCRF